MPPCVRSAAARAAARAAIFRRHIAAFHAACLLPLMPADISFQFFRCRFRLMLLAVLLDGHSTPPLSLFSSWRYFAFDRRLLSPPTTSSSADADDGGVTLNDADARLMRLR